MKKYIWFFIFSLLVAGVISLSDLGAVDTNTVSSTVVTDKSVPTASAPSIVINNNDVCRSGMSVGAQTGFIGLSTGHTITDSTCERIKLARSLYGMGMKVAGVSLLCQDARVFDSMMMSGTPCPYRGKIGSDATKAWKTNYLESPEESKFYILRKEEALLEKTRKDQGKEKINSKDDNVYEEH
tara:strand:- start:632 stop:1180 length:549 start_codon:yes stop_codon:yes gene_type:complete